MMADPLAFLKIPRRDATYRPADERVKDYRDVAILRDEAASQEQALRCMDCGTPFCSWACPLGNYVPDWNEALSRGDWQKAFRVLQATNNIPEITSRLCPAPCEPACVLETHEEAVTIRENELAVVERAFQEGIVQPRPPARRTGKTVAVVGSGPAGLCCAAQLNQAGHRVVVFERDEEPGGILRYGIPDFKLEKWVLDRRLAIWKVEGVEFMTGVHVGVGYPVARLREEFDAICLTGGACVPRNLPIEGRELRGVYFAMDYLVQSNRRIAGKSIPPEQVIDARGKRVVVIGGGDTGSDCVGTAHRQGATHVIQIELLPRPPEHRKSDDLWPDVPAILKTSSSHEEGGQREWDVLTKQFLGADGRLTGLSCVKVKCIRESKKSPPRFQEIPGTAHEIKADLVLLAMGFISPERKGLLEALGVKLDARGNVQTNDEYATSVPGIYSAGDMRRGQSLVVWAVREGRKAAESIDRYLEK